MIYGDDIYTTITDDKGYFKVQIGNRNDFTVSFKGNDYYNECNIHHGS